MCLRKIHAVYLLYSNDDVEYLFCFARVPHADSY